MRAGSIPSIEPDDDAGFVPIFDGKTLDRLGRRPDVLARRKRGIVGETTPEKVVKLNNFLIWRGGTVKDFELKVEFKISGTNSGIQYRSVELPDVGKWVLKGYQADIDFGGEYVGNVHEERGRKPGHVVLAKRGQVTRIPTARSTRHWRLSRTARCSRGSSTSTAGTAITSSRAARCSSRS